MALTLESWRALSAPRTIAIVGATDRATPTNFTRRLLTCAKYVGYRGKIFLVNPTRESVYGERCWSSIADLPEPPDAIAIGVNGARVLDALREGIRAGAKAFLIYSGGFGERGSEGTERQRELQAICKDADVACLGPNCLGILNFSASAALCAFQVTGAHASGPVAAISQSGAVASMLIEIAGRYGLSFVASTGNEAVTTMEDLIGCAIDDSSTRIIVAFVEALRRPREIFHLAERAHAAGKPIIVMKVGLTREGGKVSYGHTGALTGSGAVYRQAFAQAGIVMVDDFDDLAQTIELFAMLKTRPKGCRLGMLGTSGGELAAAADRTVQVGLHLPPLGRATEQRLREALHLPADLLPQNPVDAGTGFQSRDSYHDRMRMCIRALASDDNIDMIAVLQSFSRDNADLSLSLNSAMLSAAAFEAPTLPKPILVIASQAGRGDEGVLQQVTKAGLPALEGTRQAMGAIAHLDQFLRYRREPLAGAGTRPGSVSTAGLKAWPDGAVPQSGIFSLLESFDIPVVRLRRVDSAKAAEQAAREIGGPVVMKIDTAAIIHKSDVGGVVLDVGIETAGRCYDDLKALVTRAGDEDGGVIVAEQLAAGVEFFVGAVQDASFGPVIACGIGGRLLEILGRTAILIPPFSQGEALDAIERSGAKPFLSGFRGGPKGDLDALAAVVVRIGNLALGLGDALEVLDLNPIIVSADHPGGCVADARLKCRQR